MAPTAPPQTPSLTAASLGTLDPMRVSEKGQVTIPTELRDALGITPGTELTFETDGETLIVRRAPPAPRLTPDQLVERLRGRGDRTLTTDEILAMTRGELLAQRLVGRGDGTVAELPLLTRDPRRYRAYFPTVALTSPDAAQ